MGVIATAVAKTAAHSVLVKIVSICSYPVFDDTNTIRKISNISLLYYNEPRTLTAQPIMIDRSVSAFRLGGVCPQVGLGPDLGRQPS
jgi:hypothetical protein